MKKDKLKLHEYSRILQIRTAREKERRAVDYEQSVFAPDFLRDKKVTQLGRETRGE